MALRWRDVGTLGVCLFGAWLALGALPRMPVLVLADFGFASLGKLAGEVVRTVLPSPVPPAAGALLAPVAVPLVLAAHFGQSRSGRHAAALCLAWAGTVLTGLAVGLSEAADPGPAGPGSPSDWAVVLGPRGLGALDRTAGIVDVLRGGAVVLFVGAALLCLAPLVADAVRTAWGPDPAPPGWHGPNRRRV